MNKKNIRNFAIIAHIDHGKSTLADRILEQTNTIQKRDLNTQHMDTMDLEQERGITIKLNAAQIEYKEHIFHLIDTPGHVDFTYEVSRSLAACEGALLLVDATQGIEAQTLANVYLALDNELEIIPVINKVDLPSADPEGVKKQIEDVIGIPADDAIEISAKTGQNVDKVLDEIIKSIPAPEGADDNKPLKALVFDSYFDPYRGVVLLVRIFEGRINKGDEFVFMSSGNKFDVTELGIKNPAEVKKEWLESGEVGWIAASIRDAKDVAVGDTITLSSNPTKEQLPGYKKLNPVVFTGFYPIDGKDYEQLKESLEKIALSDSSITFEPETSLALGHGFRVGFLGMLHMEVLQERLEREFNVPLIATAPSVEFNVYKTDGSLEVISNPTKLPDPSFIDYIEEPFIKATIVTPEVHLGGIMELCQNKRGEYLDLQYIDNTRRKIVYKLPLVEIIFDFFDKLKSISKGYATFDYDFVGYGKSDLIKVDILLNSDRVDAFSFICHRDFAYYRGRDLTKRLKEVIPKHNFEIPVQAAIGAKVIARETIKAYRKDVTAKLYGGDRTRRDKLLKKQKAGKKRAKQFGSVEVPQDAFLQVLRTDNDK
ncbi:translation elongation factor 4 [Mycoplasma marinum]|uniref:Elongation factor 4 n=1 Tax=Mycoplasma marinum TaxID=1937190 RepID=A0A4R0XKN5_9MOLU|nr:translation elongation factor 4 [Mycoplasma marinum]TCG11024.1 elongation factor 4 [Mycoplasma marinum]